MSALPLLVAIFFAIGAPALPEPKASVRGAGCLNVHTPQMSVSTYLTT